MTKIKLSDIIIIILFILSLIMGIWYVFGESPTFEQTLLIFILTLLFTISGRLIKIDMQLRSLSKRFNCLSSDFKTHINLKKH